MLLLFCLLGFGWAALMPLSAKILPRRTLGLMAALFPAAVIVATMPVTGSVLSGTPFVERLAWVPGLGLNLTLYLDGLALTFVWIVCGIALAVFTHAGAYMASSPKAGRFFAILLLFTVAMLGVVTAGNLLSLFVFWELTSITSYLLIGFKSESEASRKAALRALLVTGGGGLALLAGIVLLGIGAGSLELTTLLTRREEISQLGTLPAIAILVILGALTKSAQFPFHFWLPGAMAAPTPVSAFLHSATMVKAGVFLIARMAPLLGVTEWWTWPLLIAGGITMVMGALRGPLKQDLKQMLAYSTLSVLGMLTLMLGLGTEKAIKAAIVLLLAHALYKATLFLVAGTIDHATGTRDISRLSGLRHKLPFLAFAGVAAAVSMIGLPPLLGFLAKETVLEGVLNHPFLAILLTVLVAIASVGLILTAWLAGIGPFFGKQGDTEAEAIAIPLWVGPILPALGGIVLGLFPGLLNDLVRETAANIHGAAIYDLKLKLWHGFTPALFTSLGILTVGALTVLCYRPLVGWLNAAPRVEALRARTLFDLLFDTTMRAAKKVAGLLDGRSPAYGLTIILLAFLALGVTVLLRIGEIPIPELTRFDPIEFGIGALIIASALVAFFARSMLVAAASLGSVGFGIAMLFFLYGAIDLAITQILVETLIVLLFVLVVYAFPSFKRLSSTGEAWRDLLIAGALGAFVTVLVWITGAVQIQDPISLYHAQASVPEGYGRNVVNVTLVDFRALDTFGEIIVLMIAALGVTALLHKKKPKGNAP